ncbi:MAG: aldose 1-epimerase [Acidobacteria bacterium]|nr:aldose 1-epimerase [Acidobacteriota bacterium]
MNLLQITASIPGRGEVEVLAAPPLEEAANSLNSEAQNTGGVLSFSFGGAFLVPYANRIRGQLSTDGKNITTDWNGRTLTLPAVWKGKGNPNAELHAIHGLILNRRADSIQVHAESDGQSIVGVIHGGDFDHHWPSKTDVTITISLEAAHLDATIVAKNIGDEDEPMGIGWHPYFAFPSGDRKQVRLQIPASKLAEVNNYDDVFPTGRLTPVAGSKYDFSGPDGKALSDIFLDDNFSALSRTSGAVSVKLIDRKASYGLRVQGLSQDIKTIQVYAPPEKPYAAVEEQFNFADPFSSVWREMNTGMVRLKPGQETTWKVRLELFTPSDFK